MQEQFRAILLRDQRTGLVGSVLGALIFFLLFAATQLNTNEENKKVGWFLFVLGLGCLFLIFKNLTKDPMTHRFNLALQTNIAHATILRVGRAGKPLHTAIGLQPLQGNRVELFVSPNDEQTMIAAIREKHPQIQFKDPIDGRVLRVWSRSFAGVRSLMPKMMEVQASSQSQAGGGMPRRETSHERKQTAF